LTKENNRYLLLEIANLEVDSKIGKDRHFIAADRKNIRRIILGLFSVVGTAIIASKAIKEVFHSIPLLSGYEDLFISLISLSVGISTAILGFLGLETQVTQHRLVGNMYIDVSRKARRLINRLHEGEDTEKVKEKFQEILTEYLSINKEGESCPTSKKDSKKSLYLNDSSRKKIKNEIKRQDDEAMSLSSPKAKTSLLKLASNGVKVRAAKVLCCLRIIDKEDRDKYINEI
jgi:hypothetical protein